MLQQRESEVAERNRLFDAAISNMSQGMCLYDAQQRIVFANDRYAEIYGLTPEQAKPGTTLREMFAARAVRGAYGAIQTENFIRDGLGRFSRHTSRDPEAGGWALHLCRAAPDAGWRPAQHARGH